MNKTAFELALSEIVEVPTNDAAHPFQTIARFIFADDSPNDNKQGVPYSEFQNVAKSAINMPLKMNFDGTGVTGHPGSFPIGVIRGMESVTIDDDHHQLIAEAVLWADEYPEEVAWLKKKYAEGEPPGVSWELRYKESDNLNGIEWLKNIVTAAATFVKRPAYGSRTQLLALASIVDPDPDDMAQDLLALAQQYKSESKKTIEDTSAKGGKKMTEEEAQQLRAEAASKQTEIDKLLGQITEKDTEITTLKEEVASLQKTALIEERVRKYTEAGFMLPAEAAEADKKKNLFASFSQEQYDAYIEELASVKKLIPEKKPDSAAAASLKIANASLGIPKVDAGSDDSPIATLRQNLRSYARPNSVE